MANFGSLYGGYLAKNQMNRQQEGQDLAQLGAMQGILAKVQAQQEQAKITGILSQPNIPIEQKMESLTQLGPAGVQLAGVLAQQQKSQLDARQAQEKAQFFSPQGQSQFMTMGQPAIPVPSDEAGGGPGRAATAPVMDFSKMLQTAASRNFIPPETYANHLAQREQARVNAEMTKQARADALAQRQAALEAQMEDRAITREQRAELAREQMQNRREMMMLAASLRQPPQPRQLQLDTDEKGNRLIVNPDGTTTPLLGPDGKQVKGKGTERALPAPLQKQLTEAAELADATERFKTTFKDTYAGKTITGELGNVVGRHFGDDTGQSQWWQDYELHQSQIRNKLFGSALTTAEIEAWNKSAINPRMESSEVRKNLTRRDALEKRGIDRLMKGSVAGGYNREQIEAFTGRSVDTSPAAPAATPATPNARTRIRFDSQGRQIP